MSKLNKVKILLRKSIFYEVDLANTIFRMATEGSPADKAMATKYADSNEVDPHRLWRLIIAAFDDLYSVEAVNKAPLYNRELPADADRLTAAIVELNDPITQGVKAMLILLNKINYKVLENHKRTIKAIEPFVSCKNSEVKMYAIESMIQCGLKEDVYPLMEVAAKPIFDLPTDQRTSAFDNEGHWGGCVWRPIIFLAACKHEEAELTVETALRNALTKPRDIFQMNQGLLFSLHFSFDGLNDTILELFRQLVQKTVLRDQSDLPWVNGEIMSHFYMVDACTSYLSSLKKIKHDAIRDNAILEYASILDDYLRHLYSRPDNPIWTPVQINVIKIIGLCGQPKSSADLVCQLHYYDPAVVWQAMISLITCVGIDSALQDILEAGASADGEVVENLSNSLKRLVQDCPEHKEKVFEFLDDMMSRALTLELQDAARHFLTNMGGASAMKKLQARSDSVEAYRSIMRDAEQQMQRMFKASMDDAKRGFQIALSMDVVLFVVGIAMLLSSAILAIMQGKVGASTGVTGGLGSASTMYSMTVSKPRQQVKAAVDHMMYIKVVFLGYLRELQQADQTFGRRMMEETPITEEELLGFKKGLQNTMTAALAHLRRTWSQDVTMVDNGGGKTQMSLPQQMDGSRFTDLSTSIGGTSSTSRAPMSSSLAAKKNQVAPLHIMEAPESAQPLGIDSVHQFETPARLSASSSSKYEGT